MTAATAPPATPASGSVARWRGGVVFTPGLMAFTGRIGDTAAHAHAAVQVLFVADGALTLTDRAGRTAAAGVAIIPPGVAHQVSAEPGPTGFVAFLDPDSAAARAAVSRMEGLPADQADSWVAAGCPRPPALALTPAPARPQRAHPVVADALRAAAEWPGGPPALGELAARVGISGSRLSHVFTQEVGLPYAAWRRWTRLHQAFAVVRAGGSLTAAAHSVGFADSAHLTRTCRELIGITPTAALIATGWRPEPGTAGQVG